MLAIPIDLRRLQERLIIEGLILLFLMARTAVKSVLLFVYRLIKVWLRNKFHLSEVDLNSFSVTEQYEALLSWLDCFFLLSYLQVGEMMRRRLFLVLLFLSWTICSDNHVSISTKFASTGRKEEFIGLLSGIMNVS